VRTVRRVVSRPNARRASAVRRSHRASRSWLAAVGVLAALLPVVAAPSATLAATTSTLPVDQRIAGDPACDAVGFPGFAVLDTTLRQSFKTSRNGLKAVELCINAPLGSPAQTLTVNVYDSADPENPGANRVGTKTVTPGAGFGFTQITFDTELPTRAGASYVLEIPVTTPLTIQWRATCGTDVAPCAQSEVDRYPRGTTNLADSITPGPKSDFGFRSLPSRSADLTAAGALPKVVCAGKPVGTATTATVTNSGPATVAPFDVRTYLSPTPTVSASSRLIGTTTVPGLEPGASAPALPAGVNFPADATPGRGYLLVHTDATDEVTEALENNNLLAVPTVVACGAAVIADPTMTAGVGDVAAGAVLVPAAAIPVETIAFTATGAESLPVQGLPVQGLPVQGLPVQGLPVQGLPVQGLFTSTSALAFLQGLYLSDIPVTDGWESRLAGTALANTPPSAIRFGEYLALPNAPVVRLSEVDLARSPLRRITLASIALAGLTYSQIAPNGPGTPPVPWCDLFAGQGFDCAELGITPSSTLVDGDLSGLGATVPWDSTPFPADISGTPLARVPLTDYRVLQTPLRDVGLASVRDAAAFVTCLPTCTTLGAADGSFRAGKTVGDLLAALVDRTAVLGQVRLGDVLLGILPDRHRLPVGALNLHRSPTYASSGATITYTLSFASTGAAPVVDPTFVVTPPPGTAIVPGSSELVAPDALPLPDPVAGPGGTLVWRDVATLVATGRTATLRFRMYPGLVLGVGAARVRVTSTDEFGPVASRTVDNVGAIRVVDAETLPAHANDDVTAAPVLEAGVFRLGHISRGVTDSALPDIDWYRLPVPKGSTCSIAAGAAGPTEGGCDLTLRLTSLGDDDADLDLLVLGTPVSDPSVQGSPVQGLPVQGLGVHDDTPELNYTSDVPADTVHDLPVQGLPVQGLPVQGLPVQGLSAQRGTSDEQVEMTSESSDSGHYLVGVFHYNGGQSAQPYVLSVDGAPAPAVPACTPRSYNRGGTTFATPAVPASTKTLVLYNHDRMGDIYGPAEAEQLLAQLRAYAARPEVAGVVYPVESDPDVRARLAEWDAAPCDVAAANRVTSAVSALQTRLRTGLAAHEYTVLVGSDEVFPSARVHDDVPNGAEPAYTYTLVASAGHNAITAAARTRHFLTDDAYATERPMAVNGTPVFVPDWTVSRLVETPAQIRGSLLQYAAADGRAEQPPDQSVLVTGYDLLTDGGDETAGAFAALGADKVARLICESWTRQDLLRHLTGPVSAGTGSCNAASSAAPDIAAVNGHAQHHRFQPAAGTGAAGDADDLVSTADLSALPPGRIVFSVGCHFGLNIADSTVASPTADQAKRLKDWAETIGGDRAGILVANYGFGYGDTETVGYSEKLMSLFAARLASGTVGQALRDAKRTYFLEHMGLNSAYDQKSLQIAAMYGPPQMRVVATDPAPPTPPAATPLQIDPITGLAYTPFDSGTIAFDSTTGPDGRVVSVGGDVLLADGRPVLPQTSYDVTNRDAARPGHRAIGFFLTGFDATTETGQDLAHSRALIDEDLGEPQSLGDFPVAPGTVTSLGKDQRFLLWPAQFSPTSSAGARKVVGDLQLRNSVRGMVLYSDQTGEAARFLSVTTEYADAAQTQLAITARVYSATAVRRVNFFVGSRSVDLQRTSAAATGITSWSGTVTVAPGSGRKVLGQAVNDVAVSYWGNKGDDARTIGDTDDGLLISLASTAGAPVNGWFTGDVTATVTQSNGSPLVTETEYSLDRAEFERYADPVLVTGTGLHPFAARSFDSGVPTERTAARTAFIDVTPPTVVVTSPGSTSYELNAVVPAAVTCRDAGSGVQSCLSAAKADTSKAGTFTFTATATDVAGNQSTHTVTYTVRPDTFAPTVSIAAPVDGLVVDYTQKVTVTYSCDDTGGAGVASCVGSVPSGGLLDTQTSGTFQFCVTATDASGNTTRTCRSYTVRPLQFEGFLTPTVNPPSVNPASAGNTLPFRFRVFNSNSEIKDPIGFKFAWRTVTGFSPLAYKLPDPYTQGATSNPIAKYDSAGGSVHFNAITENKWKGSKRVFVVILPDGQERYAYVQF